MGETAMRRYILAVVVLIVLSGHHCSAGFLQKELRIPGSETAYRVRCSTDMVDTPVCQQLDVAYYSSYENWVCITDRIELPGLRCPEELNTFSLAVSPESSVPCVVVWGGGDTRSFVYVAKVTADLDILPRLEMLLDELHEGAEPKLRVSDKGELQALTLSYAAMHVVPDSMFPGHIVLARTYTWVANKRKFVKGPMCVDTERERELSLLETLRCTGSSARLDLSRTEDEGAKTTTYRFKPRGILWSKLPENLRSVSMAEVVVGPSGILDMRSTKDTGR
jgi:hypothetical protein